MQAIITKVLPATNYKPPRMLVKCNAARIVLPYDFELNTDKNHMHAALAIVKKLETECGGWSGEWVCSELPSGERCWVNASHTPDRMIVGSRDCKVL